VTTVTDADMEGITRTIWHTLFELPLETSEACPDDGDPTVTSVVHIDGAWRGAVTLRCPVALAAMLTSSMFQSEAEPEPDDVRDAIGELANMTAGNVKALLPETCTISLPAVAFGSDYELSVLNTTPIAAAAFTCRGHPLVVTLLHRFPGNGGG
jgi:chemotaxis protein CheX